MDELEEMIAFWDDFADDYDSIQEESATTLLDDLNTFVKKQPLFPVSSFLDLDIVGHINMSTFSI